MTGYDHPMTSIVSETASAATRAALHVLAEHVLAPDLERSTGRIGLRVTPGGFGQPEHLVGGARRRLRVDGTSLVVDDGTVETWHELSTLGAARRVAGLDSDARVTVYEPSTAADDATDVRLDPVAAAEIAGWFAFAETALERFRSAHADRGPAVVQLWPEHFDLACSFDEINFGASPGDDERPPPYLYVGPWTPRVGPFWTESYGAARNHTEVGSIDDAVGFFLQGLTEAVGPEDE